MPTKLLTDLIKIYNNNNKYRGELYNILNIKLQVFYNCCNKVRLPKDQYYNTFSVMLKNHVSAFYYSRIIGRPYNFIAMVAIMKEHFKTKENY